MSDPNLETYKMTEADGLRFENCRFYEGIIKLEPIKVEKRRSFLMDAFLPAIAGAIGIVAGSFFLGVAIGKNSVFALVLALACNELRKWGARRIQ